MAGCDRNLLAKTTLESVNDNGTHYRGRHPGQDLPGAGEQALHNSEGTVKNHVSSILAKLGVRDRTRAVLKAIERGLL